MKVFWLSGLLLVLTACTDDKKSAAGTAAYDDSWYVSAGWPGEYPSGFTILEEGVVLAARAEMDKAVPKSLQCPLPRLANYNQWNHERVQSDKLKFLSASKIITVGITADVDVPADLDEKSVTLNLKQGEQLSYLTYIGEGFGLMRYQDKDYQINEADLGDKAEFGPNRDVPDDLWANIPCAENQRGWVLYAELQGLDGVGETEHTEYGVSRDLEE